jgi:hypothetical protein
LGAGSVFPKVGRKFQQPLSAGRMREPLAVFTKSVERNKAKTRRCTAIWPVFDEIRPSFELSSLSQSAYLAPPDMPVGGDRLFVFYF